MIPKLFAFDLDGTLLDSNKRIRPANLAALREMHESGAVVALASGRTGHAMRRYVPELGFDPALVTLNGAEVFTGSGKDAARVRYAPLDKSYAEHLTRFVKGKPLTLNFYHDDKIYTVKTDANLKWAQQYTEHIGVVHNCINDFSEMDGISPSKIIFVGDESYIDELEKYFTSLWRPDEVYVCRTWDYYLEFMNPAASKGLGLRALCEALCISISDAAAYGDAENDLPMIEAAGVGVAMKNSRPPVIAAAPRVTELTNDEDWLAREWDLLKSKSFST